MTYRDLSWMAGLLEGEGCFDRTSYSIRIKCGMTDRDVIERLCAVAGCGNIVERRPRVGKDGHARRTLFHWACHGQDAAHLMGLLRPLMGSRRGAKIDLLLEYHHKKLAAKPVFKIQHVASGTTEETDNLRAWCREHNVHLSNLQNTFFNGVSHTMGYRRIE